MKCLVLGATGQIGAALLKRLSTSGHEVTALVRKAGDDAPACVRVLERPSFTPEVFQAALLGMDHVIYGIGIPEQFSFDDTVFDEINCQLLQTFLDVFRNSGVKSLTYLSTYEVFAEIDNSIRETHPVADETKMTPYFQSMIRAYRTVVDFARATGTELTTIHPAAVYGGRNTGGGITDYMENLASRNWTRLPFINPSSFPVVHVDSLADAIVRSLDKPGSYIVSDTMTSLQDIAKSMRAQARSYVPLLLPLSMTLLGVQILEQFARITRMKPFASAVQVAFLTKGWVPHAEKAQVALGWKPLPLEEGIGRFLSERWKRHASGFDQLSIGEPAAGTVRVRWIALGQGLTAAGLALYWLAYFAIGLAPQEPPPGYFVFQNSFTYADLILATLLATAACLLTRRDASRRAFGRGLSLICAGALFFLGGLDITFNVQNSIYATASADMIIESLINIWCVMFGFVLAYQFSRDTFQRS